MNGQKINGVTERLADSAWLKALERLAIPLIVVALAWLGTKMEKLNDLHRAAAAG